jgi:hypothetical protein
MHLTGLDFLLWAASFAGHLTLLFVLWFRRRAADFPLFTTFITANVVRTIVLYLVYHFETRAATYFYTYWSLAILDVLLQLCVVYEISSRIFRPLGSWAKDVRRSFVRLVGLSIVIAAGLTWLANPPARWWTQVVIKGNFFSAVLMSELFVALIALSVTVGLPWKAHVAKISLGLGTYSLIDVVIETGHAYFGWGGDTRTYGELAHIRIAVYVGCVAYWIVALWRDARPPRELSDRLYRELSALQILAGVHLQSLRSRRG